MSIMGIILEKAGEAFLNALVSQVGEELWSKLKGNPTQKAFQKAIGASIQRYAMMPNRLALAQPLLMEGSLLTDPDIATELTHLVRFERAPNARLIGLRWKEALLDPPQWRDFTHEAELLLGYLETELRTSDVFAQVFVEKSLQAVSTSTANSSQSLASIEAQLVGLTDLISTQFSVLVNSFREAPPRIQDEIRDYTQYIDEKTRDFVGRQFIFDAITRFANRNLHGYFFIFGEPGIGKSAFAAQLVKRKGYVHHFNIRGEGINRTDAFLRNVCAQLVANYQLPYTTLPIAAAQDAAFLNRLLIQISHTLPPNEKVFIVVDALDEVDTPGHLRDSNPLFLPLNLPPSVYFIVTLRTGTVSPRIEGVQDAIYIEHDADDNVADIRMFIEYAVERPGIQSYLKGPKIDANSFVEHLIEKSEGNFMYLRYVLPEIERGAYKDLELRSLPIGLKNYYEDHWRRMRGQDEKAWFKYKLPIIMALTVVTEPISIDIIKNFSGVAQLARIRAVIQEWQQFLSVEPATDFTRFCLTMVA